MFDQYQHENFDMMPPGPPPPFLQDFPDQRPTRMATSELHMRDRGRLVELSGRLTQKRTTRFFTLRDQFGTIQLVAPLEEPRMEARFQSIQLESHLVLLGTIECRPRAMVNGAHENGAIEVHVRDILAVRKPQDRVTGGNKSTIIKNPTAASFDQSKRMFSTSTSVMIPGTAVQAGVSDNNNQETINRGVTAAEHRKSRGAENILEAFRNRKRMCAELRLNHVGEIVELYGWIDEGRKSGRFMQLRDGHGSVQVVVDLSNHPLCEVFAR